MYNKYKEVNQSMNLENFQLILVGQNRNDSSLIKRKRILKDSMVQRLFRLQIDLNYINIV